MNKIKPTIVVFGCTGTVGTEVIRQLQKEDCNVRGVLRTPDRPHPISYSSNITYVNADLKSPEQVYNACMGADALFLLTATSPYQVEYEINVIAAAKKCGVKRVVKLSAPILHSEAHVQVSEWHHQIDEYLINTIDEYCCLRPHSFMQNWERNTFTIQAFGKIYGALGTAKRNYIDCRDVAAVAVHYLLSPNAVRESSVVLAGPQALTNQEIASKLSLVTGRAIEYVDISPEEFYNKLTKRAKLPNWLANHIVELDNLANHVPEPIYDTVTNLIGQKPRIIDEYFQESRHLFKRKSLLKMIF
ncbi:NAD(P)H-binding protein [Myroides marinus]|uniref:NmrA family NAD(P)-binding protein n=1 Tax=Myroides marinus TaxID=703342 RepID=UPI002576F6CE|nr:NAD(P)H-binding protein [Myroides marinus]MDM1503490.1 NAD(P)H-binding protein [Myroides marinus]